MNKVLENKYPYLTNFFKTSIAQNRLFHSIILYGSNVFIQYAMALELARQLNCLENGDGNCQCQNCRWIRANQHPAVTTISPIDSLYEKKKSFTVISEEQISDILDTLVSSSDYHRVFIFCDAEIKTLKLAEIKEYEEFISTGFKLTKEENENKIWYPSGVKSTILHAEAANSMLKTLEEPPSNVTFIFLTNNKDDLIQTIVSRSQAFSLPDAKSVNYDIDFFEKHFSSYPKFNKELALDFANDLLNYQINNNAEPKYVIDCIQYYLVQLARTNSKNPILLNTIYKDIEKTQKSKNMLDAYLKEQIVFEDLAFYFAKR